MQIVVRRVVVPCLLLVVGVGSAIYGANHHAIPVLWEREEEVTIPLPSPLRFVPPDAEGQPSADGPPGAEGRPPGMPPSAWQPPPVFAKAIRKTVFTTDEMESKLIREVSVGGVTRTDSGRIRRTYSGNEAPTLCPT